MAELKLSDNDAPPRQSRRGDRSPEATTNRANRFNYKPIISGSYEDYSRSESQRHAVAYFRRQDRSLIHAGTYLGHEGLWPGAEHRQPSAFPRTKTLVEGVKTPEHDDRLETINFRRPRQVGLIAYQYGMSAVQYGMSADKNLLVSSGPIELAEV